MDGWSVVVAVCVAVLWMDCLCVSVKSSVCACCWESSENSKDEKHGMAAQKRARLDENSASSGVVFPALGEDESIWLAERQLTLRHGTSLRVMSQAAHFLNDSKEFNEVDVEEDWTKWTTRVPDAFTLYYATLFDPLVPGTAGVHCVLRAVLDGWPSPRPPHRHRLVIDYVATAPAHRGKGCAGALVEHVSRAATALAANVYVLALEDSCVYWMAHGFVLEENARLQARLNIFPDTHLLRRQGDAEDPGDEADLALAAADDEGEEGEEGAEGDGGGDDEDAAAAAEEEEEEEDWALQAAIRASLGEAAVPEEDEAAAGGGEEEDEEMQAALALSMADAPTAAVSPSAAPPVDVCDDDEDRQGAEQEEQEAMRAAIELSLHETKSDGGS